MNTLLEKLDTGYSIYICILLSLLYLMIFCSIILFANNFDIQGLKIYSKKIIINILLVFIGFYIW